MQNSLQTLRSHRVTWLQTNLCYSLCYNLWLQTSLCYSNARCIPGWRHVGLFPTICPTTKNRNSIRFFATYRQIPDVTKSLHSAGWTDAPKVSKEKLMSSILLRAFYSLQSFQMPYHDISFLCLFQHPVMCSSWLKQCLILLDCTNNNSDLNWDQLLCSTRISYLLASLDAKIIKICLHTVTTACFKLYPTTY